MAVFAIILYYWVVANRFSFVLSLQIIDYSDDRVQKAKLLNTTDEDLVLFFTADTQFDWKCVEENRACKECSSAFKQTYGFSSDCERTASFNQTNQKSEEDCVHEEAMCSNRIQRAAMVELFEELGAKAAGFVINGDLTEYGHPNQLDDFQSTWMNLPTKMFPGLGNHDYENNINDCGVEDYPWWNHCAERMLKWFVDYEKLHVLGAQYTLNAENSMYSGSFAYAQTVCSKSGKICARLIQLQNRPNYKTSFDAYFTKWEVQPSIKFLKQELQEAKQHSDMPIFINLHYLDAESKVILVDAIEETFTDGEKRPIFVLFGHLHSEHRIHNVCSTYQIPFIFCGSVPKNRFTVIKIKNDRKKTAEVFLLSNRNGTEGIQVTVEELEEPDFRSCTRKR